MDFLLAQPLIDCDVVMAAHHGSPHSEPEQFMAWSTPEWVVISGGGKRVTEAMELRFAGPASKRHVLRTDQAGAVQVKVDTDEVTVEHWRTDRWLRCD